MDPSNESPIVKAPAGIREKPTGVSVADTLKRICVLYWPLQSAPTSQVIILPVPDGTPTPIAPFTEVAGTLKVVPPSLEISSETITVGVSAVTL